MTQPAPVGPAAPKAPAGLIGSLTGLAVALAESVMTPPERHEPGSPAISPRHAHARDAVCDHCPICQLSLRAEQLDPQVITDLAAVARDLLVGWAGSMAAATRDRTGDTQDQ